MNDQKTPLEKRPASWIGIGLVIGAGVGVALNDIPLGPWPGYADRGADKYEAKEKTRSE